MGETYANKVIGILTGKKEIIVTTKSQGELKKINFKEGDVIQEGAVVGNLESEKEKIERDIAYNSFLTAKKDVEKSRQLKKYLSKDELRKKEDEFKNKKGQFELKEYNLKSKNIISPIEGVLTKIYIKEGENISSGTKAFEIIQYDELHIDLDIMADIAQDLKVGQKLEFTNELIKQRNFEGEIFFIGPTVDKASGTVNIKLKLPNPKNDNNKFLLKPGSMVKVSLN